MGKLVTGAQSEWKIVKLTKIDQLFCHSPKNFWEISMIRGRGR